MSLREADDMHGQAFQADDQAQQCLSVAAALSHIFSVMARSEKGTIGSRRSRGWKLSRYRRELGARGEKRKAPTLGD